MVGKICPKTGKNKARHFCQAQFSPMKWAIFAIFALFHVVGAGVRRFFRGYEGAIFSAIDTQRMTIEAELNAGRLVL